MVIRMRSAAALSAARTTSTVTASSGTFPMAQPPFTASITRHALFSTWRRSPGSSIVVVPASSIAAGPSTTSPARSRSRGNTRYSSTSRSSVE